MEMRNNSLEGEQVHGMNGSTYNETALKQLEDSEVEVKVASEWKEITEGECAGHCYGSTLIR